MQVDDLILVSVDDHVVEPRDMFDGRLAARFADRAPRVIRTDAGHDVWEYEGVRIPNIGLNAVAGRPPEEYSFEPTRFEDMREGCYDVDARVADMNRNGVLASLCFPSFPQFCGQLFSRSEDLDLGLACLQAYNDWHIEAWCGAHPGRFIPLAIPPIWDPHAMAAEVERVAAMGCTAITFSENPAHLGWPSWHSDHWEPFLSACEDTGTVICLHIGSSSKLVSTAPDAPVDVMITLTPVNSIQAAADVVWSPVLRRHPRLKFALSEGGIGWIPYFLERLDYVYAHHAPWTHQDFGGRLPSEVFLDHFTLCFIDDSVGVDMRDRIGVGNITWECDYPHSDSTWPRSPELVAAQLDGVAPDEVASITHRNAMELFRFDPFEQRPQQSCTVGALRAAAPA
ncbi:MAG: amidohydrolase family protein [Acidimicrobiia bacterium]